MASSDRRVLKRRALSARKWEDSQKRLGLCQSVDAYAIESEWKVINARRRNLKILRGEWPAKSANFTTLGNGGGVVADGPSALSGDATWRLKVE